MVDVALDWNDLVTVKEVSERLHVHTRTVERWFKRGLPAIEIFGKLYTTKTAINRMSKPHGAVLGIDEEPTMRRRNEVSAALDRLGV
jgi:hypothetical protein